MKKVLVYGLQNVQGGIEKYLLSMQRQLCADFCFCYLVEDKACIHSQFISSMKGELVEIPSRRPVLNFIRQLYRTLKQQRKESSMLYINVSNLASDIIAVLVGILLGFRVLMHSHNGSMVPIEDWRYRLLHQILEAIAKVIVFFLPVCRLAVSDKAGKYLYKIGKYSLVYPGIVTEQFCFSPEKRNEIRERYDVHGILCGFVGRFVEIKNPYYLLDVFAQIYHQLPDSRLLMVGDGPLKEKIQEYARSLNVADAVIFTGEVENVHDYYHAMDVLLCTSFSEGLSLVAVEGQASGLPCVVAENNYPRVIQATELLRFMPLAVGSAAWAEQCIHLAHTYTAANRGMWNERIKESAFDIENAAKRLSTFFHN